LQTSRKRLRLFAHHGRALPTYTLTSDLIAAQSISLAEPRLDGEQVYWLEGRPQELGRYVEALT
jgi:hypothetical protein